MELRRAGEAAVVSARGDIDLSTLPQAVTALAEARATAGSLVLDLREVGFMDTSGLRLVIEEQQRAADNRKAVPARRGPSRVQRLFEIAGLAGEEALFVDAPDQLAAGGGG